METKNYSQILKDIKENKRDRIYYVDVINCNADYEERYEERSIEETYILDSVDDFFDFIEEKENEVKSWCDIETCYMLRAYYIEVDPNDISDYDEEDTDAELYIKEFVDENRIYSRDVVGLEALVEYDYKKLEGCVLLFWDWDRYVGYARNYEDIRIAYDEDERITIPIDHTFKTQCDVLLTIEDIQDCDTEEELLDAVYEALYSFDKWRNLDADSVAEEVVDEIYSHSWMYGFTLPKREEKED